MEDTSPKPEKRPISESELILGAASQGPPAPEVPSHWRPFYRRLLKLRDRVLDEHRDLTAKAREIEPHYLQREPADVAEEDFQRDFDLGKVTADQQLLLEIESALDRIENNTYGRCELTGQPIPRDRLKAVPWTRYTVEAEREIERQGGGIHTGLTPIQSLKQQFGSPGEIELAEDSEPEDEAEAGEPTE